jgi:hypothetical protein
MTMNIINRFDLCHYSLLKARIMEIDEGISEAQDELTELDKCNIGISPVYSGMPKGNERKDKIADFIIRLEKDRQRLNDVLDELKIERAEIMYKMRRIRGAVNKITDKLLKDIINRHYFEGESIIKIAESYFITTNGIYKKINRFFRCEKQKS